MMLLHHIGRIAVIKERLTCLLQQPTNRSSAIGKSFLLGRESFDTCISRLEPSFRWSRSTS